MQYAPKTADLTSVDWVKTLVRGLAKVLTKIILINDQTIPVIELVLIKVLAAYRFFAPIQFPVKIPDDYAMPTGTM